MRKKKKKNFFSLILLSVFFLFPFMGIINLTTTEAICPKGEYYKVIDKNVLQCTPFEKEVNEAKDTAINTFTNYLNSAAKALSLAAQGFALVAISYASYLYMTSDGHPQHIMRAKKLYFLAFIGILIAASSHIIIRIVAGVI